MSENDVWEKAAACVRAARETSDPKRRATLICLGGFWLNLARVDPFEIDDEMADHIATMEQMQADMMDASHTVH